MPTVIAPTSQDDLFKKMKSKDVVAMGGGATFADSEQVLGVFQG